MSSLASVQKIHQLFTERGLKLALAESCTGGQLAAEITKLAGSSKYFMGGVVSYHGSVKEKLLRVPADMIKKYGEVSNPVALAMAQGARQGLGADWGVGISGVAGPTGGSVDKPVGHVCFAVVGPGFEWSGFRRFGAEQPRTVIQQQSVEFAAHALLLALDGKNPDASQ